MGMVTEMVMGTAMRTMARYSRIYCCRHLLLFVACCLLLVVCCLLFRKERCGENLPTAKILLHFHPDYGEATQNC